MKHKDKQADKIRDLSQALTKEKEYKDNWRGRFKNKNDELVIITEELIKKREEITILDLDKNMFLKRARNSENEKSLASADLKTHYEDLTNAKLRNDELRRSVNILTEKCKLSFNYIFEFSSIS